MSSRIGGAIAPLLLVWLFAFLGGWKLPVVLLGLLGIVWCALVLALVSQPARRDARGQRRRAQADPRRDGQRSAGGTATPQSPGPGWRDRQASGLSA